MIDYAQQPDKWEWLPYFKIAEFTCKGSQQCLMNPEFMQRLYELRETFGKPMIITSGYRSPAHNKEVSNTGDSGPHTTGRAVDISIRGTEAFMLLRLALERGFTGIGLKQHGPSRIMHLDDLQAPPRPNIWTYEK